MSVLRASPYSLPFD